jgi:hypothetical protein
MIDLVLNPIQLHVHGPPILTYKEHKGIQINRPLNDMLEQLEELSIKRLLKISFKGYLNNKWG